MNSPYKGKFRVSQQYKGSAHDGLDLVGVDSKEIHSTVNGVVERAGWENPLNRKQGFGKYVRIKKDGTNDRYYFGHLSEVKVKVGDRVKITDVIGIEGSTGYSTGSHCHYCIRGNASKKEIKDVCVISGIPNAIGTYDDGYRKEERKNALELAQEILEGKWGNGEERRKRLAEAGYNYSEIQAEVNKLVSSSKKKANEEIAREVLRGEWGNGAVRKSKLTKAGYDYAVIQALVNKMK
jgi:murein DD-endopeptidase MepM/ murein hydrolase activator NlpD